MTGRGYIAQSIGGEHPEICGSTPELNYSNDFEDSGSILLMGGEGTTRLDDTGFVVGKAQWKDYRTSFVHRDFLECIKPCQQPNCPVGIAQRAVAGPHPHDIAMSLVRRDSPADDLVTES